MQMTIQVTYRLTRRLSMRIVKNGDVHVSAPLGLSRKKVEVFIEAHRDEYDFRLVATSAVLVKK